MINPNEIQLPSASTEVEETRWSELFKYPRLVASGMLTGLTQTGGASLGLWGATLLVLVMGVSPADAAYLMIWVSVSAVLGRFFITALIEPLGRRGSATLCMVCAGVGTIAQGYLYDAYIGGWSLLYVLFIVQTFFGSANYSVVGPYMAEIWPARLRASGMGVSYGTGNLDARPFGGFFFRRSASSAQNASAVACARSTRRMMSSMWAEAILPVPRRISVCPLASQT
jgi:MFS family permease